MSETIAPFQRVLEVRVPEHGKTARYTFILVDHDGKETSKFYAPHQSEALPVLEVRSLIDPAAEVYTFVGTYTTRLFTRARPKARRGVVK